MNDMLSALRNEKTRIIGICEMGGVGKTTMVREIIKRLQGTNKRFDDVVMSTVSATVSIRKIQAEIAESLDMKLVKESESIRALRLHETIKDKRILIILDDVWSELKLQDVGIHFDVGPTTNQIQEGCKILLTSRNEEVCEVMGV
ncbi:probable disease resistance protein At1g61300 [Prunus avium]|uniref:Probable disease resistance protein At1g61300 n=1 Tax=Prunus avium TaxID=42229 RepID=A0A6P5T9K0_PRUAV|nr:probable disease resistance protein At1g61300 [Prunus avium]